MFLPCQTHRAAPVHVGPHWPRSTSRGSSDENPGFRLNVPSSHEGSRRILRICPGYILSLLCCFTGILEGQDWALWAKPAHVPHTKDRVGLLSSCHWWISPVSNSWDSSDSVDTHEGISEWWLITRKLDIQISPGWNCVWTNGHLRDGWNGPCALHQKPLAVAICHESEKSTLKEFPKAALLGCYTRILGVHKSH